jgi:hypothetical protein
MRVQQKTYQSGNTYYYLLKGEHGEEVITFEFSQANDLFECFCI